MRMCDKDEGDLNPTYVIPQVLLYNLESGSVEKGVNRIKIVRDRDHEEYAFPAKTHLPQHN